MNLVTSTLISLEMTNDFDAYKIKQVIMSLIGTRIKKSKTPKKYSVAMMEILRSTPIPALKGYITIIDSKLFFDINGIYNNLLLQCGRTPPEMKKVKKPKVSNFNDWKPDAEGVWRSKGRIRGMHSQRTQKKWGSAARPARIKRG